jgi:hypothetical protein
MVPGPVKKNPAFGLGPAKGMGPSRRSEDNFGASKIGIFVFPL